MEKPDRVMYWLSQAEYDKATSQLRMQFTGVFSPFRVYGQNAFIPGAVEECMKLAEDFGLRVRGVDKPIALDMVRRKNGRNVDL